MGAFDTVIVTCPICGEKVGRQTKNGPCALLEEPLESAHVEMQLGVDGVELKCGKGHDFWIRVQVISQAMAIAGKKPEVPNG